MASQATGDGQLAITVTFALGTDLDTAQVLVQNRVAVAESRLPEEVRRIGVTVRKSSPDMLMVIHLLLAGRLARPALHLELRDAAGARRARPARRRRRRAHLRRARLCDAHLARPGEGRLAQPDRRRGRRGAARAERPGRLRRGEPAAGAASRAPSSSTSRRSAGCPIRASSATSSSRPTPTAASRGSRTSPGSSSRRRTTPPTAISTSARPCRSWSSSGPARTRSTTAERLIATMEELAKSFPPGAALRHRLQPDRVHRRIGRAR